MVADDITGHPLVSMIGICKSFASVGPRVLDDVSFDLRRGEVHVLAGENGAGKSTLMRILGGAIRPDSGSMRLDGDTYDPRSPSDAAQAGIAMIHQELSLCPQMSVIDNLLLGREPTRCKVFVKGREKRETAKRLLARVGLSDIDLYEPVQRYPLATRQLIEIAKALAYGHRVLVMDEPTSALRVPEAERLFQLIHELTTGSDPVGVIYISHRMEEIYRLANRISVLRDGKMIRTDDAKKLPRADLVQAMVGRAIAERISTRKRSTELAEEPVVVGTSHLLEVKNLSAHRAGEPAISDVYLHIKAGEVLGVAGLQGSGSSTLLHALFGDASIETGSVIVSGEHLPHRFSLRDAMRAGLALVTADRRATGILGFMGVGDNLTLAALPGMSRLGGIRRQHAETSAAQTLREAMHIRCRDLDQPVGTLSGGNQQKVVLGKWMQTQPKLFLLDDPTRGVDIGAKQEIYEIIEKLTSRGCGVILASTEMSEIVDLCDRVLVMHRGSVAATLKGDEITAQRIVTAAMGVDGGAAA